MASGISAELWQKKERVIYISTQGHLARRMPDVLCLSSKLQTLSDWKVAIAVKLSASCSTRDHKGGDFGKVFTIVDNFLGYFILHLKTRRDYFGTYLMLRSCMH